MSVNAGRPGRPVPRRNRSVSNRAVHSNRISSPNSPLTDPLSASRRCSSRLDVGLQGPRPRQGPAHPDGPGALQVTSRPRPGELGAPPAGRRLEAAEAEATADGYGPGLRGRPPADVEAPGQRAGHREARHGRPLAPQGLQGRLALENVGWGAPSSWVAIGAPTTTSPSPSPLTSSMTATDAPAKPPSGGPSSVQVVSERSRTRTRHPRRGTAPSPRRSPARRSPPRSSLGPAARPNAARRPSLAVRR